MIAFRVVRVVSGVTEHFISRLPEWANTCVLLMFGMTLLQTGNTFDQSSFSIMAHYATEDEWGWFLAFIGTTRMIALILNGTFRRFVPWSVRIRAVTSTLSCFAWFCISLSLFLANPNSTGAKTYAALLAVDMIMAIHLGGQAGRVDRGMRNGRS